MALSDDRTGLGIKIISPECFVGLGLVGEAKPAATKKSPTGAEPNSLAPASRLVPWRHGDFVPQCSSNHLPSLIMTQ